MSSYWWVIRVLFKRFYVLLVSLCFERIWAYKYNSLSNESLFQISTSWSNGSISLILHTHTEALSFVLAAYICSHGSRINLLYGKIDETEGDSDSEFYTRWITISCSCKSMHHQVRYFHSVVIPWNSPAWREKLRNYDIMKYKLSWNSIILCSMVVFKLVYFHCFCHCYFMNATNLVTVINLFN